MKRVSDKRRDELARYHNIKKKVWLQDEGRCQYPIQEGYLPPRRGIFRICGSNNIVEPHHIEGRTDWRLLDPDKIILLCRRHHIAVQGRQDEREKLLAWQRARGILTNG